MSVPGEDLDVEPEQVARWLTEGAGLQVIDVREGYEREAGHVAGSRHIELSALSAQAGTVDQARPVVFYCRVGGRSTMAAQAFRASGYDAYSMRGGLLQWVAEQHPLAPEGGFVADH